MRTNKNEDSIERIISFSRNNVDTMIEDLGDDVCKDCIIKMCCNIICRKVAIKFLENCYGIMTNDKKEK